MSQPGFYGKLASRGDFVSRDLPQGFIQRWDCWLAAGLRRSQAQMGERWLDAYLVSPLWRFVLAPGVCGDEPMAGVIMPSVDCVGRYFPLTVAQPLAPDCDLVSLVAGPQTWFEGIEQALLDTLQPDASPEHLCRALELLPGLDCANAMPDAETAGMRRSAADTPEMRRATLAQWGCKGASLWWGDGSEQMGAALLRCLGLPPEQVFTEFLQAPGAL